MILRFRVHFCGKGAVTNASGQWSACIEPHLPLVANLHTGRFDEFDRCGRLVVFIRDLKNMEKHCPRALTWISHFDPPRANRRLFPALVLMIVLRGRFERMAPRVLSGAATRHDFRVQRQQRGHEYSRSPVRKNAFIAISFRRTEPVQTIARSVRFGGHMKKEVTSKLRFRRFDSVKHYEKFARATQIQELPRDFACLVHVIALCDVGGRIRVIRPR